MSGVLRPWPGKRKATRGELLEPVDRSGSRSFGNGFGGVEWRRRARRMREGMASGGKSEGDIGERLTLPFDMIREVRGNRIEGGRVFRGENEQLLSCEL
ncbi:MAG: hypothetical protein QM755_08585 [Luteolibacter sp.]